MAANDLYFEDILDALVAGFIGRARLRLPEARLNLYRAAHVLISSGQCDAFKSLIKENILDVDEYFLLHHALEAGQEDIAKWLIASGADVNRCLGPEFNVLGHCPLHLSVACSVDMIRFLLHSGADVNKCNGRTRKHGETALHMAVKIGNVENIKLLIDHGADIEAKAHENKTALIYACDHSTVSPDCVQVLLENGANPNSMTLDPDYMTEYCLTSTRWRTIHFAIVDGNTQKLQLLLQHGAQIESRTYDGNTGLLLACKKPASADCVRILLEHGAFPNVVNNYQQMPLTLARERNDGDKISLLKQYGATEEERSDEDETDLMSACQKIGDVESVKHLLENNASPNVKNRRGETAIHFAALAGDVEKLEVLVQYKSDVNCMDDNGITPLMKACEEVSVGVECVRFLLDKKALPNLTDISGKTAIHYTSRTGNVQKLQLLLQHGANVNAVDVNDQTALMLACGEYSVNVEYVRFLLENNALVNLTCFFGKTALEYAIDAKDLQKVKVLIEYYADLNIMSDNGKVRTIKTCFSDDVDRDCVKFLIENSPLPRLADHGGNTCLHWAALSGDEEMIDLLLQNEADVNAITNEDKTPLMLACGSSKADAKCVLSLLNRGALPSLANGRRETALDFAMETRDIKKARLLIDYGANVEYNLYFLKAARKNNREFLELFHEVGVDISAEDSLGQNAIMLALKGFPTVKDIVTVQWLIDKGVSVNQRSEDGCTPLMAAVVCGNTEIVKLLLEAGADVHAIGTWRDFCSTIHETTALTLSMDNNRIDNHECVELLIRAGAVNSLPRRHNDLLHVMVIYGNCRMIGLLLKHGMAPTLCRPSRYFSYVIGFTYDPVSPLTVAQTYGNLQVVQYLIDNLSLCPCDMNGHLYHSELRAMLESQEQTDIIRLMDEFYSQPKSLFQLCYVTVSNIVGGVPGRVDRINSLPLPQMVKNKLLFKNSNILEDPVT